MKKLLLLPLLLGSLLRAQDHDLLLNHDLYHYLDRMDIRGYADTLLHSDIKPYGRLAAGAFLTRVDTTQLSAMERRWHDRMRLLTDDDYAAAARGRGLWGRFYTNHRDLLRVEKPGFRLLVNPVLHTSAGVDRNNDPRAATPWLPIYYNTRGLVVRGHVGQKVGFYTEVADNVMRFPQFIFNSYTDRELIPGEGFVKRFGDVNGMNYFSSRAYLTWSPFQFLRVKFGKDRMHWGNGYQSLLLSDHAPDVLLLTLTARIWKLEYVSHFTQGIDFIRNKNDTEGAFPRKYAVFHQLAYKPNHWLSVAFFESIIYQSYLPNGYRGFELQYLNPLIFYRAIEQYTGSPDNGLMGLQVKANLLRHMQLYGQLLIDDYNYGVRNQGTGYWGNKVGWQAGAKYVDAFGVRTLDLQAEYNLVRPYTYQHFNQASNYTHYGQPLGHAAGANLKGYHLMARYHPFPAWNVHLVFSQLDQGLDSANLNYGGIVTRPFVNRAGGDFDNFVGQGIPYRVTQLQGRLTWQPWEADIYLEVEGRYRQEADRRSLSALGGLRVGIAPREVRW